MKIGFIYDQGTAPRREDGLVVAAGRLFGVLDGVSAPYSPAHPPKLFDGMSGGEMVARFCERFAALNPVNDLRRLILKMNAAIGEEQVKTGVSLRDAGKLAGATFSFAQVRDDRITVVQAGDCIAVVELKDGEIVVTPNQVRLHDEEMNGVIEQLQREVAQKLFGLSLEEVPEEKRERVRKEMWDRFYYKNLRARRECVNNADNPLGFGLLNGQPQLADMLWKRTFPRQEVATLLLFTDGIVPWSIMKSSDDETIGQKVLSGFKQRGLAGLLLSTREKEKKVASTSYIDEAEATAISLDFSDEK